jgi:hypothetical protein
MTPNEAVIALYKAWKSDPAIARRVGSSQSTINRIRRGRIKCDYDLGVRLVSLAQSELGPASETVAAADGEGA